MKDKKLRIILLFLCLIIIFLSSCTDGTGNESEKESDKNKNEGDNHQTENTTLEEFELFLPPAVEKSFFESKVLANIDNNNDLDKITAYYTLNDSLTSGYKVPVYVLDKSLTARERDILLGYYRTYTDLTGTDIFQMYIDNDIPYDDPKTRPRITNDYLLLDVEWFTADEYIEMVEEAYINYSESFPEWAYEQAEKIKNNEIYFTKTINGKPNYIESKNPYNNTDSNLSLIDVYGCYIYNIYPFYHYVYYYDENGEYNYRPFEAETEKEFYLIADELIEYCDKLFAQGKITQEEYEWFAIKSPLDYYIRLRGWFDEDELENFPLTEYSFPQTPELIKNKDTFSILFVGNSLTYTNSVPSQLQKISEAYGIIVNHESITPGGAALSGTRREALQEMQDNKYDYVVFQDYGNRPTSDKKDFFADVEILCEAARQSGAIPVFFNAAWATDDDVKPAKDYQAILTAVWEKAAKMNGAIIINAAEAWVYAYDKYPDISLYISKTDYHPNPAGSYLTACTFASALFDLHIKDIIPENTIYHGDDSIKLGQAAWEYVSYYNEHKKSPEKIITVPDGLNEKIK